MERFAGTFQIGGDNSATERDDETGKRHSHGTVPLVAFGPVLWILGVVDSEGHQLVFFVFPALSRQRPLGNETGGSLLEILLHIGIVVQYAIG